MTYQGTKCLHFIPLCHNKLCTLTTKSFDKIQTEHTISPGPQQPREVDTTSMNKQIPLFCWLLFTLQSFHFCKEEKAIMKMLFPLQLGKLGEHDHVFVLDKITNYFKPRHLLSVTSKKNPQSNKTTLNPNPIPH